MWKRQRKFDFPQEVQLSITVSRFTGHVKAYWLSCQIIFAQILEKVPYRKVFKELYFPRSFSGRVKAPLTGTPKTLFAKTYVKLSPNVRKRWVKSEFPIKKFFPQSNFLFTWNSVQNKLPKASRWKSYKFFAQNPRIKTKELFFKRESPKTFFGTRRLRLSTLPEVIQTNWKKWRSFQKSVRPQNVLLNAWEADVTTLPSVFCSNPNLLKTWKLFHSIYFILKMFHWRWWMLTWQSCQFRLKLR